MSIELKQAAQDAAEAIDWLLKNIRLDAPHLSGKAMGNAEKCASALRTAIQQAEAPHTATAIACGIPGMAKTTCPYCEQGFAFEFKQAEAKMDEMDPLFVKGALSGVVDAQVRDLWPTKSDTHPAPGVPVGQAPSVWNSIQIASWIGSQLMHEPSMFERNAVCKFVRSLGRHPTLLKHSPKDTHPTPGVPEDVAQDAQRYRWLRRKACVIGKTTYCGEETGQPILDFVNLPDVTEVIRRDSASTLDAAIDAAMLTAAQAQKGQP